MLSWKNVFRILALKLEITMSGQQSSLEQDNSNIWNVIRGNECGFDPFGNNYGNKMGYKIVRKSNNDFWNNFLVYYLLKSQPSWSPRDMIIHIVARWSDIGFLIQFGSESNKNESGPL